jgi:UDP-2-acetamido-2-deoxy-ribo-hexuluronate aminotransferase
VQENLKTAGIPTAVHYPIPLNDQPAYKNLCCPDCTPVSRILASKVMSLPMGADLSIVDQRHIVATVLQSCGDAVANRIF